MAGKQLGREFRTALCPRRPQASALHWDSADAERDDFKFGLVSEASLVERMEPGPKYAPIGFAFEATVRSTPEVLVCERLDKVHVCRCLPSLLQRLPLHLKLSAMVSDVTNRV